MRRLALALAFAAGGLLLLALGALSNIDRVPAELPGSRLALRYGPLEVWTAFPGEIQAERMTLVASSIGGGATLIELVPEGVTVAAGEVLARFDASELERQVQQAEEAYALARAELEGLERATLPIEHAKLAAEAEAARLAYARERRFLDETAALEREGLMSAEEVEALRASVAELERKAENLARELALTDRFLHPSRLRQQQAKLRAAEQSLARAREALAGAVLRAPAAGVVIYRMLQIGSEFRTARVGDTLAPNQPFLMLPDLTHLVVQCHVAESDLALARPGNRAVVRPLAFPALALDGVVRRVGGVAQSVAGRPSWQRFFTVEIALGAAAPELRPGMSVSANVLAYRNPEALLIPRAAVRWEAGRPVADFATPLALRTRELMLGYADARHYEVLAGAEAGDEVYVP